MAHVVLFPSGLFLLAAGRWSIFFFFCSLFFLGPMDSCKARGCMTDPYPGVYFLLLFTLHERRSRLSGATPLLVLLLSSPLLPAGDCETRQRHGYREKGPGLCEGRLSQQISRPWLRYQRCADLCLTTQFVLLYVDSYITEHDLL